MKLYDTIEAGQLRQWNFVREGKVAVAGFSPSQGGKSFLVVGIDGIRCDTLQEGGTTESFYVQWLISNSRPVKC